MLASCYPVTLGPPILMSPEWELWEIWSLELLSLPTDALWDLYTNSPSPCPVLKERGLRARRLQWGLVEVGRASHRNTEH